MDYKLGKEKLNWWWFLLIGGILIPAIFFGVFKMMPIYVYFSQYYITGLNPYVSHFFNFFLVFLICILFKIINKWNSTKASVLYFLLSAGILFLSLYSFLPYNELLEDSDKSRQYVVFSIRGKAKENYYYWVPSVFIVCTFVFFCIKNFPSKSNTAKDDSRS